MRRLRLACLKKTALRVAMSLEVSGIWHDVHSQMKISVPTSVSLLLYKIPWLISLHFVGQLGPDELAAATLATTVCNITGMSICLGMRSAILTLGSQTIGRILQAPTKINVLHVDGAVNSLNSSSLPVKGIFRAKMETHPPLINVEVVETQSLCKESHLPSGLSPIILLLFRGILLQFAIIAPIGVWWVSGIKASLVLLGQEERISIMAQHYLRILALGLWFYSIQWALSVWMQVTNMADIPAYGAFCGLVLHVPFNIIFVRFFGFGFIGVAMATVLFQVVQPLFMASYLVTNYGQRRLSSFSCRIGHTSWQSFRQVISSSGILLYLRYAMPGIVLVTEWWASETIIFLGGRLAKNPEFSLGAMGIYQSINTFCVMFPMGLSASCSTRVGILLGKNDYRGAALACRVSIVEAIALCTFISSILIIVPHSFLPALFTGNTYVIDEARKTIPFLAIYVIADGLQVTLTGAIRGCGRQCTVVPVVLISYWMIGIPSSYIIAFRGDLGTLGLVIGMTLGKWIHLSLLCLIFTLIIDWKKEAGYAQERSRISIESNECLRKDYGSITANNNNKCSISSYLYLW